jgi:hypothetical protein
MIEFFKGMFVMYLLAIPFLALVVEATDSEGRDVSLRFAIMWPLAAIEIMFKFLRGDFDNDGTGTD